MKRNKLFNKIFDKPIKVEKLKKWYPSIPNIKHKNIKKEESKNYCRKPIRPEEGSYLFF